MIPRDVISKALIDRLHTDPLAARNIAGTAALDYQYGRTGPGRNPDDINPTHADALAVIAEALRGTNKRLTGDDTARRTRAAAEIIHNALQHPDTTEATR